MDSQDFGFDVGEPAPKPSPLFRQLHEAGMELSQRLHAATERDRHSGPKAAAVCPNCAYDSAIPSFTEVKGNTHVLYTCVRCGEDYL